MLDPLIFNRSTQRRDIEVQALPSQPGRSVLIKSIRVFFVYRMKEAQLVFPFGFDDSIRGESCPDLCAGEPPVRVIPVFFFVERQICVPPLKKGHNGPGQAEKEIELGCEITGFQNVLNVPPHVNGL